MDEPKKFRSLQEVKRYLDEQTKQLNEEFQVIDHNIKRLTAMAVPSEIRALEIKVMDFSGGDSGGKRRRTISTDFPVVEVPDKANLTKNYRHAEKLSQQYRALVQSENEVRMTFRDATNSNFLKLMSTFTKLKSDLEKKLRELFVALNKVAEGHAPKEYKKFLAGLVEELNENQHIECSSISSFTYVGLTKDTDDLIFAGYIVLKDAISDEAKQVPHLYIAIRWIVSGESAGDVDVFVEHDFVEPGLLTGGLVVENLREAVKAITNQLALEGFSSQIGNLPISMHFKDPSRLNREALNPRGLVISLKVSENTMVFHLKRASKEEVDEIANQLYGELKTMLKSKRNAKMRMRVSPNNDFVEFFVSNLDQSNGITPHDLEFLKEKYRLSDQVLRKVANEINNGG